MTRLPQGHLLRNRYGEFALITLLQSGIDLALQFRMMVYIRRV